MVGGLRKAPWETAAGGVALALGGAGREELVRRWPHWAAARGLGTSQRQAAQANVRINQSDMQSFGGTVFSRTRP